MNYKATPIEEAKEKLQIDIEYFFITTRNQYERGAWLESGGFGYPEGGVIDSKAVQSVLLPVPSVTEEEITMLIVKTFNRYCQAFSHEGQMLLDFEGFAISVREILSSLNKQSAPVEVDTLKFLEWTNDLDACAYYPVYNDDSIFAGHWENRYDFKDLKTTAELLELYKLTNGIS